MQNRLIIEKKNSQYLIKKKTINIFIISNINYQTIVKTRKFTIKYSKNSNFVIRLIKRVVINCLSRLKLEIRNNFKAKRNDFVFVCIEQLNNFLDFFEKKKQNLNVIKKSYKIQFRSNIIHFFNFSISRVTTLSSISTS